MKPAIMIAGRVLPLGLVLLGLACALVAALKPVSTQKGLLRLAASLLVGAAVATGSIAQVLKEDRLWPGVFGLGIGVFLMWIGHRKYQRDPEGQTPAAQML